MAVVFYYGENFKLFIVAATMKSLKENMADCIIDSHFSNVDRYENGIKSFRIQGTFDSEYQTDGSPWQIGCILLDLNTLGLENTTTCGFCGTMVLNHISWHNEVNANVTRSIYVYLSSSAEIESNSMNADRLATYIHSVITPITLNFKLFARASSTRHYYLMIGSAYIREEEEMSFNVTIDGEAYDLSHTDNGMEIDNWTN